jgi:lysophospholipase L1-like esterase
MPPDWEQRDVAVDGAVRAYRWHDILHVFDANRMRRTTPFPSKRTDFFRVLVLGDSLTYGVGIEAEQTYAAQLQALMQEQYRIEFLNLGVGASQSEDVAQRIRRFVPELQPDLVIYGICHNDFLPSGVSQSKADHAYAFPMSKAMKKAFMDRSRIARLIHDAYGKALLNLGLRIDYYDQILMDFKGYQTRFGRDVKEMNDYVVSQGLPPVVAMVLDQFPSPGSRGAEVTKVAERYLKEAGMSVIDTSDYYRRFAGENLSISKWEGHPNQIANAIWARMIADALVSRPEMGSFRISSRRPTASVAGRPAPGAG